MRIFLDAGYTARLLLDVSPAELEVLTRVLDRAKRADYWYSSTERLVLEKDTTAKYDIRVVPASTTVLTHEEYAAIKQAEEEEKQNG